MLGNPLTFQGLGNELVSRIGKGETVNKRQQGEMYMKTLRGRDFIIYLEHRRFASSLHSSSYWGHSFSLTCRNFLHINSEDIFSIGKLGVRQAKRWAKPQNIVNHGKVIFWPGLIVFLSRWQDLRILKRRSFPESL